MTTALNKLPANAFELTLTIPWADVKAVYDHVFEELAAEIEIEGFRKGKAPRELVEKKIDESKVYGEVVNHILPEAYQKALAEHHLQPIVSPKVQISSAEKEKDWQFIARACEKPAIVLGDYKKEIAALNAKGKIWTPDKPAESSEVKPEEKEQEKQKKISEIIDKLLSVANVEIAELLLESEVSRLLTQLIEDVRNAGLTYEQYLASSSQTAESVREKYRKQAEATLKLEFILEAVADDLNVKVEQAEIDAVINKETDAEKKKALTNQSYVIASILRRESTISKLLTL